MAGGDSNAGDSNAAAAMSTKRCHGRAVGALAHLVQLLPSIEHALDRFVEDDLGFVEVSLDLGKLVRLRWVLQRRDTESSLSDIVAQDLGFRAYGPAASRRRESA